MAAKWTKWTMPTVEQLKSWACGAAGVVGLLSVLKIAGVVGFSAAPWWLLTLPLWAPAGAVVVVVGVGFVCFAVADLVNRRS